MNNFFNRWPITDSCLSQTVALRVAAAGFAINMAFTLSILINTMLADNMIVADAVKHNRISISIGLNADGTQARIFGVRVFQNIIVVIIIAIIVVDVIVVIVVIVVGISIKAIGTDLQFEVTIFRNLIAVHCKD
jgi:hypothetical protein